ncbi:flagellar biosynthetic protein FliR [Albibacillus kandeliae]|uniref:flagellar biosynthetic protein FliR n=1 Tax=Albibacillus kandeliae TaxID=2174228 RepID=UPI000D68B508|nr:flagellar biosynthetic protein FliR [Albibacillus kandeliae]
MIDLTALLTSQVLGFALVFARIGAAMVFMPGFGEALIPARHRLVAAFVISLGLFPATPVQAIQIGSPLELLPMLGIEVTLGTWIGLCGRIMLSALQFAGFQVGMVSGLSNALAPNIGSFEGSTLIATALMMAGVTLIFVTDLHHGIIRALLMSYDIMTPGAFMPGDLSEQIVRAASRSFYIGTMIAAPFYVMGLVLNVGMGLSNRVMPSLPVFFVAGPLLMAAGIFVLVLSSPYMLKTWLDHFANWVGQLTF